MNRDDVIDVLSVVAAATRRTVGETDVEIWGGIIGHLTRDIAMKAVRAHLQTKPGVWLEPGHVAQEAAAILRDQASRLPLQLGPANQEGAVASAYDATDALRVECPACEAPVGEFCVRPDGSLRRMPCPKRILFQEVS